MAVQTKTMNNNKYEEMNEELLSFTCIKITKRRLGIEKNEMYAIIKPNGDMMYNIYEMITAMDFCGDLHSTNDHPQTEVNAVIIDVLIITLGTFKGIKRVMAIV